MLPGTLVSVSADGRADASATRARLIITSNRIAMGISVFAARSIGPVTLAQTIAAPRPAKIRRVRACGSLRSPAGVARVASSYPARAAPSAASAIVAHGGSTQIVTARIAMRTAALRTRDIESSTSPLPGADRLGGNRSVAAVALLVLEHAFEEMLRAEIGPKRVGHPDLRVSDLPEQEVAHAHLAAR